MLAHPLTYASTPTHVVSQFDVPAASIPPHALMPERLAGKTLHYTKLRHLPIRVPKSARNLVIGSPLQGLSSRFSAGG
jgi:hypothetical protein